MHKRRTREPDQRGAGRQDDKRERHHGGGFMRMQMASGFTEEREEKKTEHIKGSHGRREHQNGKKNAVVFQGSY